MTNDMKATVVAKCCKCGYQMTENEVWLADDMKDNHLYCFSCAPDEGIRRIDCLKRDTATGIYYDLRG